MVACGLCFHIVEMLYMPEERNERLRTFNTTDNDVGLKEVSIGVDLLQ